MEWLVRRELIKASFEKNDFEKFNHFLFDFKELFVLNLRSTCHADERFWIAVCFSVVHKPNKRFHFSAQLKFNSSP